KQNPFNTKDKIVINLDTNYRSYSEVIDFNNQFFKFITKEFYQEDYKNLYLNSSQNKNSKQGGCVSISFASNESMDTDDELENNDIMIEHVLQKIKSCKSNGFDYGEMAVLIRKNKEGVWIAKRLIQEGIKVISAESLLLSSSREVLCVFYFLQLIQYPNDETILSQFIYHLYSINSNLKNSEKTIFQITKEAIDFCKKDSLENWLHNYNITIHLQSIQSKPLYNSVQEIIDVLLQKPKNNSYIQTLLEIIWEKSIKSKMNLQELLEFWERKKDILSIAASTTADAVVILSIHKSKGLEFPVVIYPFANQLINPHKNSVFLPLENQAIEYGLVETKSTTKSKLTKVNVNVYEIFKSLEEENKMDVINGLYVALTRAKEQMHIISTQKINKNGTITESYISRYFLEFLVFKGIFEAHKMEYIFGTLERKSIPKKINNFAIPINNVLNKLNFNQINIAKNEALLWQTKQKEAIEYGDFIHHLMQEINTIKDVDKTLNKAIENGKINLTDLKEVKETILKIVTHKDLINYFNENAIIYNEQKIIIPHQKMVIPDRMVIFQDQLYLLDYKTGKKENKHLEQILQYKEILIKMNFNVVQCILVYINNEIEVIIADHYIT
ncbi:MAG: 3'-5' exonuclease, partial [Flavobacterium sp.]